MVGSADLRGARGAALVEARVPHASRAGRAVRALRGSRTGLDPDHGAYGAPRRCDVGPAGSPRSAGGGSGRSPV